ncbi:hypothetical protein A6302_04535 [Methylobrevis pamukkalensis]|uniref:Uncharacterized protein n=1 Tax=Methylobrevis pamukkalensis TaxID=1439726 RepID=A0A1E3GN17_9HYPH|nr:hypothetical protein A6302_04535 [Methylobrevis pamukkalensis]
MVLTIRNPVDGAMVASVKSLKPDALPNTTKAFPPLPRPAAPMNMSSKPSPLMSPAEATSLPTMSSEPV